MEGNKQTKHIAKPLFWVTPHISSFVFRLWLLSLDQLALDRVLDPPPARGQNETIAGGVGYHPSPPPLCFPPYISKKHIHTHYLTPTHYKTIPWTSVAPTLYFVVTMRLLEDCCCWELSGNKTCFLSASGHILPDPRALVELDGSSVDHWIMKTPEDHWEFPFGVVY